MEAWQLTDVAGKKHFERALQLLQFFLLNPMRELG